MPGDENYQRHPGKKFEKVLAACGWEQVGDGLWENPPPGKGRHRLYVDNIGIFFYRLIDGQWVKTHGLSHNLIRHRARFIAFGDMSTLDLLTGEWNGQAQS